MGLYLIIILCCPPPPARCQPSGAKKPKKTRYPPRAGHFGGFQFGKKRGFSSLKPACNGRMTTGRGSISGPVYTISAAPLDCVQDRATRHGWSLIRRAWQLDALGGMNRNKPERVQPSRQRLAWMLGGLFPASLYRFQGRYFATAEAGRRREQAAEVIPIPLLWRGARQGGVVEPCLERRTESSG